ncbi:uncharacterized protein [Misgurnus anguillicaudatus]|uniref:uncharacterized protein isoform X1 n=1 Tax=Misgurnus anguillicaudatus TaxID=75329 RepID=UPI003CCFB59B
MTGSFLLHLFILTFIAKFSDVSASPRSSDRRIHYPSSQSQTSEHFPSTQPSKQAKDSPWRPNTRVKTVAVICHENYMEIKIKTDMFDVGLPVDASELRLGTDTQLVPSCKVTSFSSDAYIIAADLTDCGTQHWITDESLIYTNLLIFSPQPSLDRVIRFEEAIVPIECYYSRKFDVISNPIRPTWIPYSSTQSAVEDLQFSLKLMTSDWSSERASAVYFLGDVINMEASVLQKHHTNLHVYFESCVATVTSDINSVPRYTFIENHGCFMDGQLTGSKSRFLPRIQNNKLQLQLDAFKFYKEERPEIYITCTLQAYPVMDVVNLIHKACSFIDGSWRSADGGDWACYTCEKQEFAPSFRATQTQSSSAPKMDQTLSTPRLSKIQPRMQEGSRGLAKIMQTPSEAAPSWRRLNIPEEETGSVGWKQEKSLGPLAIFSKKTKMGFLTPPRVKEGVPPLPSFKDQTPMPHGSLWKNGISAEIDFEETITHLPSMEQTEQPVITTSEAESQDLDDGDEEEGDDIEDYGEDSNDANKDDYGEDNNAADKDGHIEEKDAGKDNKDLWKTKVLPEEDFEESFTTPTPANEKPFEAHELGTSSSLQDEVESADSYHPLKDS